MTSRPFRTWRPAKMGPSFSVATTPGGPSTDRGWAEIIRANARVLRPDWWAVTETLRFGDWQIRYDRRATLRAYQGCVGSAEKCGCDECRNFVLARDWAYPAEAQALFAQLGINRSCEAELYHIARVSAGLHLYGGWFHFVGSVTSESERLEKIGEEFWLWFRRDAVKVSETFTGLPVVQINFTTVAPWVLNAPEPVAVPEHSWRRLAARILGTLSGRWRR